jgi:hypothetical protein
VGAEKDNQMVRESRNRIAQKIMTADLIKTAIRDALQATATLATIPIVLSGEIETAEFPLICVEETSCELFEQNGVIMRGVDSIEIEVTIHTVPGDAGENGTSIGDHHALADAAYTVLADEAFISAATAGKLRLFDFRVATPRIETEPPRRKSVIEILAIACQI